MRCYSKRRPVHTPRHGRPNAACNGTSSNNSADRHTAEGRNVIPTADAACYPPRIAIPAPLVLRYLRPASAPPPSRRLSARPFASLRVASWMPLSLFALSAPSATDLRRPSSVFGVGDADSVHRRASWRVKTWGVGSAAHPSNPLPPHPWNDPTWFLTLDTRFTEVPALLIRTNQRLHPDPRPISEE
jgi:hypothetical protein